MYPREMQLTKNDDIFEKWAGVLPAFESEQKVIEWVRKMRDEDDEPKPSDPEQPAH